VFVFFFCFRALVIPPKEVAPPPLTTSRREFFFFSLLPYNHPSRLFPFLVPCPDISTLSLMLRQKFLPFFERGIDLVVLTRPWLPCSSPGHSEVRRAFPYACSDLVPVEQWLVFFFSERNPTPDFLYVPDFLREIIKDFSPPWLGFSLPNSTSGDRSLFSSPVLNMADFSKVILPSV